MDNFKFDPLSCEGGRSAVKTALLTLSEIHIKELADKLGWSFPRTYSQLKTQAKKLGKTLIKVKSGVYKLKEDYELGISNR